MVTSSGRASERRRGRLGPPRLRPSSDTPDSYRRGLRFDAAGSITSDRLATAVATGATKTARFLVVSDVDARLVAWHVTVGGEMDVNDSHSGLYADLQSQQSAALTHQGAACASRLRLHPLVSVCLAVGCVRRPSPWRSSSPLRAARMPSVRAGRPTPP